jgi:NAD(P)-dependent dehydrogenase (short-subunit alcohol dehydrogenase family)
MKAGRVVVVTGASAGIGRATARAFAREGAHLGLIARGQEGLEAARREAEAEGVRALALPADVADADAVEAAAAAVERELGPIDVWVNDAMVTVMSEVRDMTPHDYRRVTEVTYLGTVHGTLAALRRMLPRNRGHIVQVGSAMAYRAIPLQSAYSAAKFAVRGFTDSLRTELMHQRSAVHVTMVQLPAHNTPQFGWSKTRFRKQPQPVPPIFQPEIAAEAIAFASRARRREVWVGANALMLITGNKILPQLGDWYLSKTGYSSQFTDEVIDPQRPNNLDEPVSADRGAHGMFDARAKARSLQLWATKRRPWLIAAGGALALLAGLAGGARR